MTSYQTIRLSGGRHRSPEHGACVMELASMLEGVPFTDRPQSACPVIAGLLRAYNDRVDDERRQDLYPYASAVVGTRSPGVVERARADLVAAWARETWARRWTRRCLPPAQRLVGVEREPPVDLLGVLAVRGIQRVDDQTHAAVLALIDALLMIGDDVGRAPHRPCDATARTDSAAASGSRYRPPGLVTRNS